MAPVAVVPDLGLHLSILWPRAPQDLSGIAVVTTEVDTDTGLVMQLFGRRAELAQLDAACREAAGGTGRLVLLTGEAGIGKTRLAQATAEGAVAPGMAGARGWCMDDAAAPPLWPWRRVARDVPGLAAALDSVPRWDTGDAERWQLAEAVVGVLERAATPNGLGVVLEDLHWADTLTLDLLRRLLPEMSRSPVLLIATARHDGLEGSALGRALPELLRADNTVHVPVSGLTADAVSRWLSADPAKQPWAARAADLVAQTGGNPFYIRTLVSELSHPGADVSAALTHRPTWRTVLVAPYRGLPEPVRRTIATAAVMGERLTPGVLADALDQPVQQVSGTSPAPSPRGSCTSAPRAWPSTTPWSATPSSPTSGPPSVSRRTPGSPRSDGRPTRSWRGPPRCTGPASRAPRPPHGAAISPRQRPSRRPWPLIVLSTWPASPCGRLGRSAPPTTSSGSGCSS